MKVGVELIMTTINRITNRPMCTVGGHSVQEAEKALRQGCLYALASAKNAGEIKAVALDHVHWMHEVYDPHLPEVITHVLINSLDELAQAKDPIKHSLRDISNGINMALEYLHNSKSKKPKDK